MEDQLIKAELGLDKKIKKIKKFACDGMNGIWPGLLGGDILRIKRMELNIATKTRRDLTGSYLYCIAVLYKGRHQSSPLNAAEVGG